MLWLFVAALLPGLYWDQGPETAAALDRAGITRLFVPAAREKAWRDAGFGANALDPAGRKHAEAPGVEYQMNVASATSEPWITANGWRFARDPGGMWFYDAPEGKAALAAAEAYAWGVDAVVRAAPSDLPAFGRMTAFLRRIDQPPMPVMANIGIVDDGSETTGEVLNLLARRNLLFRVVKAPDPHLDLNVKIGSPAYPLAEAEDPYAFAQKLRYELTDERRLVRIFGTSVVLVHLTGEGGRARLHLVNYGGGLVKGLRVRVLGEYIGAALAAFGDENAMLSDFESRGGATEFTVPALDTYAVVDLRK